MTDIEQQIQNNTSTRNNRRSTPFSDISAINENKNLKIPIFSNDSNDQPLKYLNEIKEYVEAHNTTDFKVIINSLLKKTTSDWWHIIKNGIDIFEEFEGKFKSSYWSEAIEDEYKNKLMFAKYNYNSESSLTCVQYATHMAAIATDLGYSEKETVTKVSKLFSFSIKSAIRGSQNKTLSYLLELLHETDNDIKLKKIKDGWNKNQKQSGKNGYKKVEFRGNNNKTNINNGGKNNGCKR